MNNMRGRRRGDWGDLWYSVMRFFFSSLARTKDAFANELTAWELTITRYHENLLPRVGLTLQKFSLAFESAGSNQVPNHRLIPKYQIEPLAHDVIRWRCMMKQLFLLLWILWGMWLNWLRVKFQGYMAPAVQNRRIYRDGYWNPGRTEKTLYYCWNFRLLAIQSESTLDILPVIYV